MNRTEYSVKYLLMDLKTSKIQRERKPLYISDAKKCARQMVRESLPEILAATYQTPSLEEMIAVLQSDFEHSFDEFQTRRKIMKSHINWSENQIEDEIDSLECEVPGDHVRRHVLLQRLHSELGAEWRHASQSYV